MTRGLALAPAADVPARNAVYAKLLRRLIPFLLLCYVAAYLDRVNVGFAKLQMLSDLKFSESVYGLGAGVFFIGYVLFEVPSNMVRVRVGARVWIGRIMVTWGLVSAAMMFVTSPTSFYLLRFLLGVAEAGFIPAIIYYLTIWFATATGTIVNDDFVAPPPPPRPPEPTGPTPFDDNLTGTDGPDSISLLAGDDTYSGLAGNGTVFGNEGNDSIQGNQGDDLLPGNQGNDTVYGGQGADTLYGGQGNDVLSGDLGDDVLVGGQGADRYGFNPASGHDVILGFAQAEGDRIDLGGQSYTFGTAADGSGSALLVLSGGGTIELAGITQAQVNAGFFA